MWKFTLIDYTGNKTEVDNPDGWEDVEVTLDRDDNWKGIFFGYLVDRLIFTGSGAIIIKDEYEVNGVSGEMNLLIEFLCSDNGIYDFFYYGKLTFAEYKDSCGDECSVTIGIEDTGDIMSMRNNYQVDVNLNSNIGFDEETELTDYDKLNFDLTIPSRGILQKTTGSNTTQQQTSLLDYPGWGNISGSGTGTEQGGLMPIFGITPLAEIESSSINTVPFYDSNIVFNDGTDSYPTTPFIDLLADQSLKCAPNGVRTRMRLKGRLIDTSGATRVVDLNAIIRIGPDAANTVLIDNQILATYSTGTSRTTEFDISFDQVLNLIPGDKVYVFEIITYQKLSSAVIQNLVIQWDTETFIEFIGTSYCEPTVAKSCMINEAVSRTIEAITNNGIKFYSTFFGRLDSEPYAIGDSPCTGLFAISNGLNVRRRLLPDNTQPGFFVTLKKLFDNLNGIYNIGLTIEPDTNRPGYNRLRFEDWRYFFQDDVGLVFKYATRIDRDTDETRLFNRLVTGYNKWTAGQFTGLDEFMTKRKYRININAIDKELNVCTDMICSTYTIEITRRLDQTTEDWQYDGDMFGLCLNGNYEVAMFTDPIYGSYSVVNVLDPNSCYNGRVSPERIALNWFNYVIQGVRTLGANSRLIFTSGEGNYIAEYGIKVCAIEGAVLKENQTIDITTFEDVTNAKPITYPEVLTFEHPLNWSTFSKILQQPDLKYKSIQVFCNGEIKEAWIKKLVYKPNSGSALITAIPKNISIIPAPIPPAACNATVVPGSITITDFDFSTGTAIVDFTEGAPGAILWYVIITKGSVPGQGAGTSATITSHPFTPTLFTPGTWSVYVIPYCDAQNVGKNYAHGTFELPAPALRVVVDAFLMTGNRGQLNVKPLPGTVVTSDFVFSWGLCFVNTNNNKLYCEGYPGSTLPTPSGAMIFNSGQTSVTSTFPREVPSPSFGFLTKIIIFNMVGITQADIFKQPGATWVLEFM